MNFIFLLWTLLSLQALASESDNPSHEIAPNQRLANPTGLAYPLYSWIGSYYNGTTTFTIDYRSTDTGAYIDEDHCASFMNKTSVITADTSILGITQGHPDEKGDNPVSLYLKVAKTDFAFAHHYWTPMELGATEHIKWYFIPTDHLVAGNVQFGNNETFEPYFNLSATPPDPSSPLTEYKINGTTKNVIAGVVDHILHPEIPCHSSKGEEENENEKVSYRTRPLTSSVFYWFSDSIPFTDPIVNVTFSAEKAHFVFECWAVTQKTNASNETEYSEGMVGKVRVEFEGRIDEGHSDLLMERGLEGHGVRPWWKKTVGYGNASDDVQFGENNAVGTGGKWSWVWFMVLFWGVYTYIAV